MAGVTALDDLREAVAVLEAAGRPGAARVAKAIRRAQEASPGRVTLEQALGLKHRGGSSWQRAAALEQRDDRLRQIHREHFLGVPVGTAAKAIVNLMPRRTGEHCRAGGDLGRLIDEVGSICISAGLASPSASGIRRVLCIQWRDQNARFEMHGG